MIGRSAPKICTASKGACPPAWSAKRKKWTSRCGPKGLGSLAQEPVGFESELSGSLCV